MAKVSLLSADRSVPLKGRRLIKRFVEDLFVEEGKELEQLSYIFCSDEYLLQINRQFLKHDYYTDIITFDLSEGKETIGEVYISVDRLKENACVLQVSFREEALRVIFHGALHLCGYKDKKKSESDLMRTKEGYYLRLFEKKKDAQQE